MFVRMIKKFNTIKTTLKSGSYDRLAVIEDVKSIMWDVSHNIVNADSVDSYKGLNYWWEQFTNVLDLMTLHCNYEEFEDFICDSVQSMLRTMCDFSNRPHIRNEGSIYYSIANAVYAESYDIRSLAWGMVVDASDGVYNEVSDHDVCFEIVDKCKSYFLDIFEGDSRGRVVHEIWKRAVEECTTDDFIPIPSNIALNKSHAMAQAWVTIIERFVDVD